MTKKVFALPLVAVCAGVFLAFENYQLSNESNALLAENVEALSNQESPAWNDKYEVKGEKNGQCVKFESTHSPCPERGKKPIYHGKNCDIVTYSKVMSGYTYKKKWVNALEVCLYDKWKDEYGRCSPGYTKYGLGVEVPVPPQEHTYAD